MLIMHIGHISRTQSFQQNRHIFHALVALELLVSLISCLVAYSARIVVDRQTDRQTNRQTDEQTDTQTNYCNPRCACAPRVNEHKSRCSTVHSTKSVSLQHIFPYVMQRASSSSCIQFVFRNEFYFHLLYTEN